MPGPDAYLPKDAADALLTPVEGFELFCTDAATFRFVFDLEQTDLNGAQLSVFSYAHSMGSGGSAFFGETVWTVGLVELPQADFPHFVIQPQSLLRRLSAAFRPTVVPPANVSDPEHLSFCTTPEALDPGVAGRCLRHLAGSAKPLSAEADQQHIVIRQDGASELGSAERRLFSKRCASLAAGLGPD